MTDWLETIPVAITVSDREGKIIEMNASSKQVFGNFGGNDLIGRHLHNCHQPASIVKMDEMLTSGSPNIYTIEKQGKKKLIFQSPWFQAGKAAGLIEISIILPQDMPHYVRD
ncbi:hypothetical protein MASR1M74_32080 [Lentimicrobium sp.]